MHRFVRAMVGSGRLPAALEAELQAQGLLLYEPDLVGWVTRRRYRAPGEYTSWGKELVSGSVAVTGRRLVVWAGRFKHIDVPTGHPLRAAIEVSAEEPGRVLFGYDAGLTDPTRRGRVEVRLRTPRAADIVRLSTPG